MATKKCPHCGEQTKIQLSGKCEHCKKQMPFSLKESKDWFMDLPVASKALYVTLLIGISVVTFLIFSPTDNTVKADEVSPILNKEWAGTLFSEGYYIKESISLKITGNEESGYNYKLSVVVNDEYSNKVTRNDTYSGEMNTEYTYWEGYLSSIDMNVDRKYWEFSSGGAKGEFGILIGENGIVNDIGRVEFQIFNSGRTPGPIVVLYDETQR